jgi:hypothetical protein
MSTITLSETTYRLLKRQAQEQSQTPDYLADQLLRRSLLPQFKVIWGRIELHAGEVFRQIRGGEFTYQALAGHIKPDRTEWQLPKSHFEKAMEFVPMENTVPIQHLQGPSYIFAILMDDRIRQDDW